MTYNSDAWLASNYTYDPATGLFRTVPGAITIPAASAVPVSYTHLRAHET